MKIDVLDLIETKNFEALTADEKSAVLAEMSEADYKNRRGLILSAHELKQSEKSKLVPNNGILVTATAHLPNKKKGAFILFQHKIPTWAAVAACLLLFFGLNEMNNQEDSVAENPVLTETIYDTIYTEKIITQKAKTDTVIEYVYLNQAEIIYEVADQNADYIQDKPSFEQLHFQEDPYCSITSCYENKIGTNVANDSLLILVQNELN